MALALALLCGVGAVHAEPVDQRLRMHGTIAGRSADFILDTGAGLPFVMPEEKASRFGLRADRPPAAGDDPDHLFLGFTAPVPVTLLNASANPSFAILRHDPRLFEWDADALIGWPVLRSNMLYYDGRRGRGEIGTRLVATLADAQSFRTLPADILLFDVGSREQPDPVLLDTGSSSGVALSQPLWDEWRRSHADLLYTLTSTSSPGVGTVVLEQVLAPELRIGNLLLRNVLVSPAPPGPPFGAVAPVATLGLGALINSRLFVDGPRGTVMVGLAEAPLVLPLYNRLGATFAHDMIARVARGGPAARADIRDGDLLLAIDGESPDVYAARIEGKVGEQPAGTELRLTLRRGGDRIERHVVLQDFLSAAR